MDACGLKLEKVGPAYFYAMTAKTTKGKYYGKCSLIPFILLDIFFATRKEHFVYGLRHEVML